jgi:hypothetical protein
MLLGAWIVPANQGQKTMMALWFWSNLRRGRSIHEASFDGIRDVLTAQIERSIVRTGFRLSLNLTLQRLMEDRARAIYLSFFSDQRRKPWQH